ncbi:MAG: hypothetical protein WCJ26_13160 [bacterium]
MSSFVLQSRFLPAFQASFLRKLHFEKDGMCRSIYSGPQNPDKNGNLIPHRIFLPGIESGDGKFSVSRYAENEVAEGTDSGRELRGAKIMEISQDEPVLS